MTHSPTPDPFALAHPVGSAVRATHGQWGLATATYDTSELYRFRLSRVFTPGPRVCWVMLNPSTATEERTDPTVERTLRFARAWGFGSSEVVNLFALRSTDPSALYDASDPVGEGNDAAIEAAASIADLVVAAWGTHAELAQRGRAVAGHLADLGVPLTCLRVTKAGHPGHPLYLPSTSQLLPFSY